jgi:hypothetical protein
MINVTNFSPSKNTLAVDLTPWATNQIIFAKRQPAAQNSFKSGSGKNNSSHQF